MKNVLIVGAGPSGLMAAHAAQNSGCNVRIIDARPAKPDGKTAGVFYLHHPCDIPNIPNATVHTYGEGTAEEYARKLYRNPTQRTSFPTQSRFDVVYDGMYAMRWLWEQFAPVIDQHKVVGSYELMRYTRDNTYVVSTMPLDALFGSHLYPSVFAQVATAPADPTLAYVEYHGNPDTPLYRASAVFGREALEFIPGFNAKDAVAPEYHVHSVKKIVPLQNYRAPIYGHERLMFAGRFGAWDKKCLTHDVYRRVKEWLSAV